MYKFFVEKKSTEKRVRTLMSSFCNAIKLGSRQKNKKNFLSIIDVFQKGRMLLRFFQPCIEFS